MSATEREGRTDAVLCAVLADPMYAKNTMAAPASTPDGSPLPLTWPTTTLPKKEMPAKPKGRKGE